MTKKHNLFSVYVGLCLLYAAYFGPPRAYSDTDIKAPPQSLFALPADPLGNSPPLQHLFGKPALVVLVQPRCGYCKMQVQAAQAFVAQNPNYQVIAVSEYGTRRALEGYLNTYKTRPAAYKSSAALLQYLGNPSGSPRTFIVDELGRIMLAVKGTQTVDQIQEVISLIK